MSASKELSKFEKEKQKLVQEKCQAMLNDMLRDDDNKYCVDCDAKGPRWASWNLGIFLCIRCAGIHRNLGVHISRVKSVNLDSWTPEQVVTMQQMGNSRARAVYEANLPDNFRRPQTDVALENFIRAKYEHTKYIAQEWVKPAPPRVDWNSEIEEQIRKKKEKKNAEATAILPKLGGSSANSFKSKTSPSLKNSSSNSSSSSSSSSSKVPPPLGKIDGSRVPVDSTSTQQQAPPPPTTTSASEDLLGLTTGPSSDPFASPVKSSTNNSAEDDLGGVFTAADASSQLKMTKESILSLYGNLAGPPPPTQQHQQQQHHHHHISSIAPNNPFAAAAQQHHQQQQQHATFGASNTNNPFPTSQPGMFPNELMGNGFAGGSGVHQQHPNLMMMGGGGVPGQQQHGSQVIGNNLSQLQQGLFSLQLGGPSGGQPPPASSVGASNSNNLLFSNSTAGPTNLNMMMSSSGSSGGNQFFGSMMGGGGVSSSGGPQQQQFHMMHHHQQQQQQMHAMNQFQSATPAAAATSSSAGSLGGLGLFQNGAATQPNTLSNNVDLLWK